MLWGKVKQEVALDVLEKVCESITYSVVIDKTVFKRCPEVSEEASHAAIWRKGIQAKGTATSNS